MIKNKYFLIIIIAILLTITPLMATPFYYNLQLESNNQEITINSINIELNQQNPENFYNPSINTQVLKLTNFNNKQITTINFTIPNIQVYDNINESGQITTGGTITLNKTTFNLYIPYNPEAKEITIYNKKNQEITTTSLIHLSTNQEATQIINNQKTTQEIPTQIQQPESDTGWKILLWILIILTIIFIIFLTRKRKSKNI